MSQRTELSRRLPGVNAANPRPTRRMRIVPAWVGRHAQKLIAVAFWAALLGAYAWYAVHNDLTPVGALRELLAFVADQPVYGPLIFVALYTIRPLVFFSAGLLSIGAGLLFGPLLGVLLTIVGANLGASLAYLIGRSFGRDLLPGARSDDAGALQRYARGMRENSFMTVLTLRFLFVPYDLVNYTAGLLRVSYPAFLLATVLGSLPGTVSFVLFGASSGGDLTSPSLDARVLIASGVIFAGSLLLSRFLKRREARDATRTERVQREPTPA